MPYIVVKKNPPWPEMHVLPNGNLSHYSAPKKFLTKERAREVAAEWAQFDANCDQKGTFVVRPV
jgi:hypothetical protein